MFYLRKIFAVPKDFLKSKISCSFVPPNLKLHNRYFHYASSDNNLLDLSEMDDFRLELMAIGASQVLQVNINPSWEK